MDRRKINSFRTVWLNRRDGPHDFGTKEQKLKRSDVRVMTRGGLTDRQEVYMLTNMDPPPTEGNFSDNSIHRVKPHIMEWYNRHMGYVDSSDHMANSYSMNRPDL